MLQIDHHFSTFLYPDMTIENLQKVATTHVDVSELAQLLAEAPSPPPSRIWPYNKLVLDFLDIEAEQGEESDIHSG
jgi:hypothetical protein